MRRSTRLRMWALVLPLPVLGAVFFAARDLGAWTWLRGIAAFPAAITWALASGLLGLSGPTSIQLGIASAVGVWYFFLAVMFQTILLPRDRVSRVMFWTAVAMGAVMAVLALMVRVFKPG